MLRLKNYKKIENTKKLNFDETYFNDKHEGEQIFRFHVVTKLPPESILTFHFKNQTEKRSFDSKLTLQKYQPFLLELNAGGQGRVNFFLNIIDHHICIIQAGVHFEERFKLFPFMQPPLPFQLFSNAGEI